MYEVISVIVPIFNSEKTLKRCVESIQASRYNSLEIILVDDGSTDGSGSVCDELAEKDHRIKTFHLPNGGVSKARNFGLKVAMGNFVAFIDSDDYIEQDYFEELRKTLLSHDSQLAVGSVIHINSEVTHIVYAQEGQVDFEKVEDKDRLLFLEWNRLCLLYGPYNKLYLKKVIQDNKIYFPEDTSYGEDLLFNVHYLECINVISYRKKPVYYYDHSNENSLSHKYRENRFENGLRLNIELKNMFIKKNFFYIEEEKFIYQRVFDDAYNAIFDLWDPLCKMTMWKKIKRIRAILSQEDVIHACNIATTADYSRIYVYMMKKKMSVWLVILREIMVVKKKIV